MCGDPFCGHSVFRKSRIQRLKGAVRHGGARNAIVVIAAGLQDKDSLHKIMDSVRAFSGFAVDNDPLGEHDFGAVVICDEKSFWRIYSFDLASEDAPRMRRALTELT